jgi:hypothetical protein
MPVSVINIDLDPHEALLIQVLDILTSADEDPFGATSTAQILLDCSHMMIGERGRDNTKGPSIIAGGKRMLSKQTDFSQLIGTTISPPRPGRFSPG